MKKIMVFILCFAASPFMLLGMVMAVAKAGFDVGEETVSQLARKYL